MAWIESHQELARHPKTKRFARSADISIPAAIGHLHLLWWWCMDYAPDGNLSQWEASDIADAVHWESEPDKLLETLMESKFVDLVDGAVFVHDWADYGGRLMAIRQRDRERKRNSSALRRNSSGTQAESAVTQHNPTQPNPTQPNMTVTQPDQPNKETVGGVVDGDKDGEMQKNEKDKTSTAEKDLKAERLWQSFWSNYPKKTFENEARNTWLALNMDEPAAEKVLQALEIAKRSDQWTKEDGKYIPKAVNWLNKKSWEGELQTNDTNHRSAGATKFDPDGMSGFHNALDRFNDNDSEEPAAESQ